MNWETFFQCVAAVVSGALFGIAIWHILKFQAERKFKAQRLKAMGIAADRLLKNLRTLPQEGDLEGFAPETKAQIHLRESYVARRMTPEESAEARKAWGLQAEIDEMVGKVKEGDPR